MIKLPKQQVFERYDALPDHLREILVSDAATNTLWLIGENHHLSEERIRTVAGVVGYIFLGFVHVEDLAREIAGEASIDRRLADDIAKEIQLKILSPVIPEIQQLYHYGSAQAGTPPAGSGAPFVAPAPASPTTEINQLKPEFAVPEAPVPAPPPVDPNNPFVIHQEEEVQPIARPPEQLVRPSFFNSSAPSMGSERESQIERPPSARLEIGPESFTAPSVKSGPEVGRTKAPQIRVVHYSGPKTEVDPFGKQELDASNQSLEQSAQPPVNPPASPEVHPENVVDLKDLPR